MPSDKMKRFGREYSVVLIHPFHVDLGPPAPRQADLLGRLVRGAELEHPLSFVGNDVQRLRNGRALDIAARHRPEEVRVLTS
jgi:hypothetical protein